MMLAKMLVLIENSIEYNVIVKRVFNRVISLQS